MTTQFEKIMARLDRIREGQDLGLGAIRDALQDPQQTNAILAALREIRDRLPVQAIPTVTGLPYFVDAAFEAPLRGSELAVAKREALRAVLTALDGWIEGSCENHGALGHRGEPVGGECWRTFSPEDIRRMVNDAAREVGLAEFPLPVGTDARENSVCQ